MKFIPTTIPQVTQLIFDTHLDDRGLFSKVFQESQFLKQGISFQNKEDYYTISKKNVLRGMHFQTPPHAHDKIVYCLSGAVFDVVLDLRTNSPTYGKYDTLTLNDDERNGLYIPKGVAHGFYSLTDVTILGYKTSSEHCREHDMGILWNSFGVIWPSDDPIFSKRDSDFVPFSEFKSPFTL